MAGDKKKISVDLVMNLDTEMDNKQRKWIKSDPGLSKLFGRIKYSGSAELDSDKWDKNKLKREIEPIMKYGLKLLSVAILKVEKDLEKSKKPVTSCLREVNKHIAHLTKEIVDGCDAHLAELEKDKGDYKKGLRDGKTALSKLGSVDFKTIFSEPRKLTVAAFAGLAKGLYDAEKDKLTEDKKQQAAFMTAKKKIEEARRSYDGDCKDAESGINYLQKMSKDTLNNRNANPALKGFAEEIKKNSSSLDKMESALRDFGGDIDNAAKDIISQKMDGALAAKKGKDFADNRSGDRVAVSVDALLRKLVADFKKVEKQIK